jgi:hypothetical protein
VRVEYEVDEYCFSESRSITCRGVRIQRWRRGGDVGSVGVGAITHGVDLFTSRSDNALPTRFPPLNRCSSPCALAVPLPKLQDDSQHLRHSSSNPLSDLVLAPPSLFVQRTHVALARHGKTMPKERHQHVSKRPSAMISELEVDTKTVKGRSWHQVY